MIMHDQDQHHDHHQLCIMIMINRIGSNCNEQHEESKCGRPLGMVFTKVEDMMVMMITMMLMVMTMMMQMKMLVTI